MPWFIRSCRSAHTSTGCENATGAARLQNTSRMEHRNGFKISGEKQRAPREKKESPAVDMVTHRMRFFAVRNLDAIRRHQSSRYSTDSRIGKTRSRRAPSSELFLTFSDALLPPVIANFRSPATCIAPKPLRHSLRFPSSSPGLLQARCEQRKCSSWPVP